MSFSLGTYSTSYSHDFIFISEYIFAFTEIYLRTLNKLGLTTVKMLWLQSDIM